MTPADHSAGNQGSRYQYTVRGTHVQLRCVGSGYVVDGVFHSTWLYEAQVDGQVFTDETDAGLIAQMNAAGAPVTDKAVEYLANLDCEAQNTP